jgi:hypothetical protein
MENVLTNSYEDKIDIYNLHEADACLTDDIIATI